MIGTMALAAAVASSTLGFPAAAASTGVGIGANDACLAVTAHPGHSYSLGDVTVQDEGSDPEVISLRVAPVTWGLAAHLAQVPASWVTFGSATVDASAGQMVPVPVTLSVPAGAAPGPYESIIRAVAGGTQVSGPGGHVALGAGATTSIVFTVGPSATPPPPCDALNQAQASGKFPPWPTRAFATTGWKQVFARDRKDEPVTPDGGPTATAAASAAAAPQPVTTPHAVTAAYKAPSKIPSDWAGWLIIILLLGHALRWLLKLLGLGK